MAILAFFGGVQPSEYQAMSHELAQRLSKALVELHKTLRKGEAEFDAQLAQLTTSTLAKVVAAVAR